ncbi:MAG TPA: glycosyltransferase family 2 protein [Bacteroidota bacterium]|nr:glycosyltransferase family 2 protein [Bacteroidota bacterium]
MADPTPEPSGQQQPERSQRHHRGRHYYRDRRREAETTTAESQAQAAQQENAESQTKAQPAEQRQERRLQQHHKGIEVSVVIPLYNEQDSLKELHQQLRATLQRMGVRYELLFVDDGSTDRSFQVLRDLRRYDGRVKIIRFRRNYGKSAALAVGFEKAQGAYVITMDADLQDDPAEIPSLIRKLEEGYDLVSGWKKVRHDPISKTIPSRFFNFVTSLMTGIKIHDFNCGLKAYRNEVVKAIQPYGELHRYLPVLAHNAGFRVGEMVVQHRPRKYGKTKFGVGRFWKGFLDLLTVLFTTRYFRRPLHLFGFWGLVFALAGIVIDGWLAIEWAQGKTALSNRPLFLGGILLIIVGIQFISLGLLGEMISKSKRTTDEYSIRDYIK